MTVGILGLGLIGGSLARAYAIAGHTVYVSVRNETMLSFAQLAGAVHGPLTPENMAECDLILLAIYPDGSATCAWIYPHDINGVRGEFPDPYANDQDWGMYFFLRDLGSDA